MELKKQFAVLGLFRQQRYIIDGVNVVSLIGKEQRIIKPIVLPAGYIQYILDLGYMGYMEKLAVYAHHLVKANNNKDNLRTVTQSVNLQNADYSHLPITRKYKKRLSEDKKQAIVNQFKSGKKC